MKLGRTVPLAGLFFLLMAVVAGTAPARAADGTHVLRPQNYLHWVAEFNRTDRETKATFLTNASAWEWMSRNVPLLDCPDREMERTYYFRWWTYRKHIRNTPDGYIVDEFLPDVSWAGKHNSISCAAGHHLREGRWIAAPDYLDDYSVFWFRKGGNPRLYSFWAADAIWQRTLVTGETRLAVDLFPDLERNYAGWKSEHQDPNGLYWQSDDRDGMEVSIGGSGYRPTINSYQYGDAVALAHIAKLAGKPDRAAYYRQEAARIKSLVQERLWDPAAGFFKVLPRGENTRLADVREQIGFTPWYFDLPDARYSSAWSQLMDRHGFYGRYGLTTAERRHPRFRFANTHECLWNGPSWPYATSVTLTSLANLLNDYKQRYVTKQDYFEQLRIYARAQRLKRPDGTVVPWIDEDQDPDTGAWIARDILAAAGQHDRGKDYNHSTFCDLVISGLIGLRPRLDDVVEVNPLVPPGRWDYFCLDRIRYHGRWLTVLYDRTGKHYGKGKGMRVYSDGKLAGSAPVLGRVTGKLPPVPSAGTGETAGGWVKYAGNPVLGGSLGTCFDISVLREAGRFRMWFSWRPKKSIALVESKDGIHWSEPRVVLADNPSSGWEDDVNRPVVLKRADGYHMWYSGQARGRTWIGYATSTDGVAWRRVTEQPVLSPDAPWEQVAVMCPHVVWDAHAARYRMWYSGGEQYEPNAIGYAISADGIHWAKHAGNPVFTPDNTLPWEADRVTACCVVPSGGWHYLFYIGFRDVNRAQIGVARSRDGITGWERCGANPIIRTSPNGWDRDACYKPYVDFDGKTWRLWYNGRTGSLEQIGLAARSGKEPGFD